LDGLTFEVGVWMSHKLRIRTAFVQMLAPNGLYYAFITSFSMGKLDMSCDYTWIG
jgi:hypothetical protein